MSEIKEMFERRDRCLYDTHAVWPGREARFFGNTNVGDRTKTNMQLGHVLPSDRTFTIGAIGIRLLGKTRDQEDLLSDYVEGELIVGDRPKFNVMGSACSMLRRVDTQKSLEQLEADLDRPLDLVTDWVEAETRHPLEDFPSFLLGYQLVKPITISLRMNFSFSIFADKKLPEVMDVRVYLFGLETRQVV